MKRSLLVRIVRLAEIIQNKPYQNINYLANDLEVSTRTIKRDLEILKSEYDAPIQYDYLRKGYYLSKPWNFSFPNLTEGEVLTLLLATSVMKQFSGIPLGTSLKSLESKILVLFQDKISLTTNDLSLLVSAQTSPIQMRIDIQPIFESVFKAISKHYTISIKYHSLSSEQSTTRNVDPYHLFHHQGVWYFCGYCHKRQEIRDFALDRIQQCSLTNNRFTIPENFCAEEYLHQAFRMIKGDTVKIKAHFDAYQAKWIRERIWHPTQAIEELPNGELLLTLEADAHEIKQWILSYGIHAEIIEPDSLRKEIKQELSEILAKYAK